MELLVKQEDGTYQKVDLGRLKIEVEGYGKVTNPGDPGWVDMSKEKEESEADHGKPL